MFNLPNLNFLWLLQARSTPPRTDRSGPAGAARRRLFPLPTRKLLCFLFRFSPSGPGTGTGGFETKAADSLLRSATGASALPIHISCEMSLQLPSGLGDAQQRPKLLSDMHCLPARSCIQETYAPAQSLSYLCTSPLRFQKQTGLGSNNTRK